MNPSRGRLRVLLSAYACEPGSGSESGNGWNWTRELCRQEEVWVLTRANNRTSIDAALAVEPLPNAHFVYFDLPRCMRFWKKGARGLRLYYYLWQVLAYFKARPLHRQLRFDLVHHVSFATYVFPSFLSLLPTPFVWGPVGGGELAPRRLTKSLGIRRRAEELLRNLRRRLGEADPFVRHTARTAAFVAATTEETKARMCAMGREQVRVSVVAHAALPDEELLLLSQVPVRSEGSFRVLSVGRMVQFKAFDLGLQAFAGLLGGYAESEYWLAGDGPERKRLAKLAQKLGIEKRCRFLGALRRTEVFAALGECDVLLFPSLHDSSGWAVIEAMAAGRPVVCLDLAGPGMQVAEDRGIKVRPRSAEQVVGDLGAALVRLAGAPDVRIQMGAAGRRYAQTRCRWSTKALQFQAIYQQLVGSLPVTGNHSREHFSRPGETAVFSPEGTNEVVCSRAE